MNDKALHSGTLPLCGSSSTLRQWMTKPYIVLLCLCVDFQRPCESECTTIVRFHPSSSLLRYLSESESASSEEQSTGSWPNGWNGDCHSTSRFDGWLIPSTQFPSHGMGRPVGIACDSYYALALSSIRVYHIVFNYTLLSQCVPHPYSISWGRCLTYVDEMCW